MFNPQNPIDLDDSEHAMTPGGAVISGTIGQTTYARVILHPQNVAKLLPPAWSDVTDKERKILAAVGGLKSGPYRKEALARLQATDADMDTLVQKGLLSKNKAGAISITTAGKNARGDERVY